MEIIMKTFCGDDGNYAEIPLSDILDKMTDDWIDSEVTGANISELRDACRKLLETAHNSDYTKCKSICCPFYDEKMEFNCCANENLCEKCMNSQHFASNSDSAKCIRCNDNNRSRLCEKCIDEIRHFA